MSGPTAPGTARARADHPDEETRYRAVSELAPADPGDLAVLLARLADPSWRVRAAAVERISQGQAGAAALPALVEVLAGGPGVGAREAAAAALSRLGAVAVPLLVERLSSDDPDLRQAAAGVLGAIADPRAVAPLTARLADGDPNVRAAAADALGKIGGSDALDALRAAADSDDATLRLSAVEALCALHASLPVSRIEALLADRALRRALYRMIGASQDPAAPSLAARGVSDRTRAGREAALAALGQQRARRPQEELAQAVAAIRAAAAKDPGLADAWADTLAAEDPFAAVGALTALAAAGAARHAGRMIRLAEDERFRALVEETLEVLPDGPELRAALSEALPSVGQLARLTALTALARLGSPAAFENVVREASDHASYVQGEAVSALGRLRDVRAVPPLAGLLADEDAATAGLAAAALTRIGLAGAAERSFVLAAVRDRAETSASAALYRTLGALGGEVDVPFVSAGLAAASAPERVAAAGALGALAQRGVVRGAGAALVSALADPAWTVRAAAARGLAELARAPGAATLWTPHEEAEALVRTLRDPEPAVRAAAAEALGACRRPKDAERLGALAEDPDAPPVVVIAALHALAVLGPLPAVALERALAHEDPEVVKEAVLAAARVPGADGLRLLREAAASPRWDVRRAAARAFAERGDPALRVDAARLAASDPDPLVARAFADTARLLGEPA
jgi:HEAT repeat protein